MSKEICISSTPHETRLAILEDEQLTEVYYERENEYTLAGSIYKGRVTRVLPGMQSAFVDLGLERDAFLYVTDFMEEQEDSSEFERIPTNGRSEEPRQRAPQAAAEEPRRDEARRNGAPVSPLPKAAAVRRPQGSSRMGPGSGGVAVAAARALAQRRAASRGLSNRQPRPVRRLLARSSQIARFEPEPQETRPAVSFSLPGESLSKYGGTPKTPAQPADSPAPQPRANVVLTKPSTLIETPLQWNGDGLLPGESISRYRGEPNEKPVCCRSGGD